MTADRRYVLQRGPGGRLHTIPLEADVTNDSSFLDTPVDNLKAAPAGCPVCGDPTIVQLPDDWTDQVGRGTKIEIIGCGNPLHYRATGRLPSPPVDHHDAGIPGAIVGFALAGCSGAIVGGLIVLVIAWLVWGRA